MAWFYLFIASFGEIFGVTSINLFLNTKRWRWLFSVIVVFSFGFFFLALAMREIPLGTAYAVWTGIGATGTVLAGIVFFGEKASLVRMFFLTCIIIGAAGLKLLS
ncbi:MAG TPA: multidrug efflux SMR transporter [Sporosarcina sp.]|nr:multidrug efflux SMR transporter [Sporosarcina sp.]